MPFFNLLASVIDLILNQALVFIALPVLLAMSLFLARPIGRNPYGAVPESLPVPQAVASVVRRMIDGHGRAGRSEFWGYGAPVLLLAGAIALTAWWLDKPLLFLIPPVLVASTVAAGVRRLHDIGRSGWWWLLALTGLGYIALLILWALPSQRIEDGDVSDLF